VPKILGSVLSILADEDINVIDMLNKSRDELAYNLIDISPGVTPEVLEKMRAIEGVINVRLIGDCA
jgi:D-3-phosphoglycerate dehydrogenase